MKISIKSRKSRFLKTTPFISVVIPAYNEASRIGQTLNRASDFLKSRNYTHEIIVVDDGSSDKTFLEADKAAVRLGHIILIRNSQNRGKGYSVRRGMRRARGRVRLFMDADNSVDIFHLEEFIRWIERGYEVVIGSINIGGSAAADHNGMHRRILGTLSNFLIRALAIPKIKDTQRGFKLFTARAAKKIFSRQTIERFGFDIEVLVIARKHGYRIKEVPVIWENPKGSSVSLKSYFETLRELIRIMFNRIAGKYSA